MNVRSKIAALLAVLSVLSFAVLPSLTFAQQSSWPTLQTQLARDHVPPGSALERYIQDNQDFTLLDPR